MKGDLYLFVLHIKEDLNQSGHSCLSLQTWPSSEVLCNLSHLLHSVGYSENTKYRPVKAGAVFHAAARSPSPCSTNMFVSGCGADWNQTKFLCALAMHCSPSPLSAPQGEEAVATAWRISAEWGNSTGTTKDNWRWLTREKVRESPLKP